MSVNAFAKQLGQPPLQLSAGITPLFAAFRALPLVGMAGVCGGVTVPTKLPLQMAAILFPCHVITLALAFNQSSAVFSF